MTREDRRVTGSARTLVTEWSGDSARAPGDAGFVRRGDSGRPVTAVSRNHDAFGDVEGTRALARRPMEFTG